MAVLKMIDHGHTAEEIDQFFRDINFYADNDLYQFIREREAMKKNEETAR